MSGIFKNFHSTFLEFTSLFFLQLKAINKKGRIKKIRNSLRVLGDVVVSIFLFFLTFTTLFFSLPFFFFFQQLKARNKYGKKENVEVNVSMMFIVGASS